MRPRGAREAIARALVNEDREFAADTLVGCALVAAWLRGGSAARPSGSRLVDSRTARVPVPPEAAFAPIRRIGGGRGWYYGDPLWRLRGLLDLPFGGAGTRRGRRDPERLLPGDTVDFWRVEEVEPDRLLRLSRRDGAARARLAPVRGASRPGRRRSSARPPIFDPAGVLGRLYWYAFWPVHGLVFRGMLRGIARAAVADAGRLPPRGAPVAG